MQASYRAAEIAAKRRTSLLEARTSFVTETVFSHPSKLEIITEAKARGYMVIVMDVGVDSPNLSVARVRGRTSEGGYDVPEDKIRSRYDRGQPLIRQAVLRADRGMVFDNSRLNTPPRLMLMFAAGRLVRAEPVLSGWVLGGYADHGILELDNNAAERGMRAIALGRKNYLFVGSEAGGKAAAIAYTLIETAKLNAVDPQAWLADTIARIPDYKITKVDDLPPVAVEQVAVRPDGYAEAIDPVEEELDLTTPFVEALVERQLLRPAPML